MPPDKQPTVQFWISLEDEADFADLCREDSRTSVARKLFLYGLDNSAAAFAAYAASYEAKRRKRHEAIPDGRASNVGTSLTESPGGNS